jgi:hypothetical protein
MLRACCGLFILALCCPAPLLAQEGRLEQVRQEINGSCPSGNPSEGKPSSKSGGKPRSSSCNDDDGDGFLASVAIAALVSPFVLPYGALGDDLHVQGSFLPYPYAADFPGYLWRERTPGEDPSSRDWQPPVPPDGIKWWAASARSTSRDP